MQDLFVTSAEKGAWKPDVPAPSIMWYSRGEPRFSDLVILLQGLLPGQMLRVVAESRAIQAPLAAFCDERQLHIVHETEDKALTIWGCITHFYADIVHA